MTILKGAWILPLLAFAAICAGQGVGQGSIGVKILTAAGNGVAIPGAPVQATNLDTKETYKTNSTSDGGYKLTGLPVGNYEISVEKMFPFVPFRQSGLRVAAGETTRLDIRLDDVNLNTLGDGGEQFAQALSDKPATRVRLLRGRVSHAALRQYGIGGEEDPARTAAHRNRSHHRLPLALGLSKRVLQPAKGNEKGGVESELGWFRRNCLN